MTGIRRGFAPAAGSLPRDPETLPRRSTPGLQLPRRAPWIPFCFAPPDLPGPAGRGRGHFARPTAFIVLPIAVSFFAMNAAKSAPGAQAVP